MTYSLSGLHRVAFWIGSLASAALGFGLTFATVSLGSLEAGVFMLVLYFLFLVLVTIPTSRQAWQVRVFADRLEVEDFLGRTHAYPWASVVDLKIQKADLFRSGWTVLRLVTETGESRPIQAYLPHFDDLVRKVRSRVPIGNR